MVRHGPLTDYDRPTYAAEYLLTIGTMDGPPELLFADVAGIEVLEDGIVAILDRQASEVRTFALDGSFLRRISRRGEGPGEISGDATLGLVGIGSGRFLLPDAINQTVSVFTSDGGLVESHRWDIMETYMPEWRAASDTSLAVRIWSQSAEWEVLAHRSVAGAMLDTLAVFAVRPPFDPTDMRFPLSGPTASSGPRASPVKSPRAGCPSPGLPCIGRANSCARSRGSADDSPLDERQHEMLLGIVARNMGADQLPPDVRVQFRLPERLPAMADIETSENSSSSSACARWKRWISE